MDTSTLALLATAIIGLVSIPFTTMTFESSFTPTGSLILGVNENEFNASQVPGSETTFYGPDKFRKEIKTAQGKFEFEATSDYILQKLVRPDLLVVVRTNSSQTTWILKTAEYDLNITKTPFFEVSHFSTPDGWIEIRKENGETTEEWYGLNYESLKENYEEARGILEEKVNEMENVKQGILGASVVINEFMPDPVGSDSATMPDGEWVELYNPTGTDIDLTGWYLTDSDSHHVLQITENNTNTGSVIIPARGFLVVYRNGDPDFSLNNNEDTVKLFDLDGRLIDQHAYSFGNETTENRTIGRCPDGGINWVVFEGGTPGSTNC